MEPTKVDAIRSLGYEVNQEGESFDYLGKTPPSDTEISTKLATMISDWEAQAYARNRSTEYPALAEQLDEIYHNGIDSWKAVIKVTKDKYPKG